MKRKIGKNICSYEELIENWKSLRDLHSMDRFTTKQNFLIHPLPALLLSFIISQNIGSSKMIYTIKKTIPIHEKICE